MFGALVEGSSASNAFYVGSGAASAAHRIIYNSANGALFFDADGTGAIAQVKFATLDAGLALAAGDIVIF